MIYKIRVLIIHFCVSIVSLYSADNTQSFNFNLVPLEIFQNILTPFFYDQAQKILAKTISKNDLTISLNLALKYQSADVIAATEVVRFYHNPLYILDFLNKKPTLLIDILSCRNLSDSFRTTLYEQLPYTQNPNNLAIPFSVPPSTQCIVEHQFKMPLLRIMPHSLTFVIHDEGKSFIIEHANMHKINTIPHEIPTPYSLMACGTTPWPLVVQTNINTLQSLRLEYDTQKILAYKPSAQDLKILSNTNHQTAFLTNNTVRRYILPQEIHRYAPSLYIPHNTERVWGIADIHNKLMCIFINGKENNGIVTRPTQLFVYPIMYCSNIIDRLVSISLLGMKNNYTPYEKMIQLIPRLKQAIQKHYSPDPIKKENLLYRIGEIESELELPILKYFTLKKIFPILYAFYNGITMRQRITLECIDDESNKNN